jgi:outer membrane lipoprotein-sorting protein
MFARIRTFAPAMFVGCLATVALGATLESVEKEIAEKSLAHKSMQFKMTMLQDITTEEMKMKSTSDSTMEYMQKGNTWNFRMESKTVGTQQVKGQPEQKDESRVLSICDGQFVYTLTESKDQKTAMKTKIDPKQNTMDAKALFDVLHEDNNIKLLPDETVDGKAVYVIEATPKKAEENSLYSKSLYYYQKDTGISVKYAAYDKAGKPVMTWTATDIRLDVDIPADRFVFKAPEGVQVMDMTQTQQESTASTSTPPDTTKEETNKSAQPEQKEKADQKEKEEKPADAQAKDAKKDKKEDKGAKGILNKIKLK